MTARYVKDRNRLTVMYLALMNGAIIVMFTIGLTPPIQSHTVVTASVLPVSTSRIHHSKIQPIVGTPGKVVVPSVGIDATIQSGSYSEASQSWTIDSQSAFHADITVPANNTNGVTLVYGHAGGGIFETLPTVQDGATATIYTKEGYRFDYSFESSRQVLPNDVSVITSSGPPRLVLQTCSGVLDSHRTLVTFKLEGVQRDE